MMLRWLVQILVGIEVEIFVVYVDVMFILVFVGGVVLFVGVEIDGQNILFVVIGEGVIDCLGDVIFWFSGYYQVVCKGDWKFQRNEW